MKIPKLVLVGSVALNAALGVVFALREHSASDVGSPSSTPTPHARANTPSELWSQIETSTSSDPVSFVTRLRAEGFPPEIVRAIVTARLWEQFAEKHKALGIPNENREYWKNQSFQRSGNAETRAALRKLYKEYTEQLRQLLGDDASPTLDQAMNERQFGGLAKDKVEQLKLITQDYDDLRAQIQNEVRGVLLPEDRQKLAYLERERQADIAALLTPAEVERYELRNSQIANQLKFRLAHFDATEQEYVALFKLQKPFDEKYSQAGMRYTSVTSAEQNRERTEAQNQLNKDVEAALGAERYREYQIKTDYEYRQVSQLAERLKLPETAAQSVVSLKLETQERVKSLVAQSKALPGGQAREQLQTQTAALAQEVATRLEQTLGQEGYAAYKDRAKNWVPTFRSTK